MMEMDWPVPPILSIFASAWSFKKGFGESQEFLCSGHSDCGFVFQQFRIRGHPVGGV
jgi:hypothetical protein